MIIQYDSRGFISNVYHDPIHPGLIDVLNENSVMFASFPPEKLPDIPATDENGDPAYEMVDAPKLDEDGNQIHDEAGNPVTENISVPVMITGRVRETKADGALHYYDITSGELRDRPSFDLPDEVSVSIGEVKTFIGLPEGTAVYVGNDRFDLVADVLQIEGEDADVYTMRLERFPHIDKFVKVIVA